MNEAECIARIAIQKTMAAITQAADAWKAERFAAYFTEDGVLDLAAHGHGDRYAGRAAIREWMTGPSVIAVTNLPSPGFVSHHLTTCRIDLTSETTAAVRTYWFVITAVGVDHSGYYDDIFCKQGEDWLLAHRRPRTLWISDKSLVAGKQSG